MLRTFTAKNFRGFRDFTIGQLERVNLIAGMNNTGKTALLEALCLFGAPNNPHVPLQLNSLRGISQVLVDAKDMWGWLFFQKDIRAIIELAGETTDGERQSLRIRLERQSKSTVPDLANDGRTTPAPQGSLTTADVPRELVLEYDDSRDVKGISRISVPRPGAPVFIAPLPPTPQTFFLDVHTRAPQWYAGFFSRLAEVGREEEITDSVRILEPRLKRLSVLVSSGLPIIHGDIGGERMVPVPYMGEGVVRLLSILLVIANAPNGMVLVDEVENGLHYSVLRDVWRAIGDAARRANVQVFATTHSWECIQKAHHAFKEWGPYEFRYYRLDRHGENISFKTLDERMLDTVEHTDLEVR